VKRHHCDKAARKRAIKVVKAHYKTAPTKAGRKANWARAMREHYHCARKKRGRQNPTAVIVVQKERRENPKRRRT